MNDKSDKSFLSIFNPPKGQNGHVYPGFEKGGEEEAFEEENLALTDELDHEILMQRDAHFGGDFRVMLDYYQKEGLGVHPDIEIERIFYLAKAEEELGQDLAPFLLTGPEAERVARARRAYEKLKELYEEERQEKSLPILISDLILSENEDPEEEIEAVVSQGTSIVPELIHIVESEDAYDTLFPGYGYAPYLAIIALGRLKDPKAIIPLFELLGKELIFEEEIVVEALVQIGKPAQEFLLKILKSRPLTKDNVQAAFALTAFSEDPEVATSALKELEDPEVSEKPLLRNYLLFAADSLETPEHRLAFKKLAESPSTPSDMRHEMEKMMRSWR